MTSLAQISIDAFGGFSGTTFLFKFEQVKAPNPSKVVIKLFSSATRINVSAENKIFAVLSGQGWGPHLYYYNDECRIEEYIEARPMGIWEMRNPYYVEQIIHKIVQYNNNEEIRKIGLEYYKDKPVSWIEETIKVHYPKMLEKLPKVIEAGLTFKQEILEIQTAYCH